MQGQPRDEDEARWLQPPGSGEVMIDIAVHEDAELTPGVREALDRLARSLEEADVRGHEKPDPCSSHCEGYSFCPKDGKCRPRTRIPNCDHVLVINR